MSLFVTGLAFADQALQDEAKIGILVASAVAGILGALILRRDLGSRPTPAASGQPVAVTYCLAMRLDAGLIFLSDTRTNAGVDNVGTYRKLHVLHAGDDRVFVLQSAGSLATTHEVLSRIDRDLTDPGARESLATVQHLFEAALYVGRLNKEVDAEHRADRRVRARRRRSSSAARSAASGRTSCSSTRRATTSGSSDTVPFLQIGETKYGKFLLELAVRAHVDLQTAAKIAIGSMISTAHANLSVGPAVRRRPLPQRLVRRPRAAHRGGQRLPPPAQRGVDRAAARLDRPPAADPVRGPRRVQLSSVSPERSSGTRAVTQIAPRSPAAAGQRRVVIWPVTRYSTRSPIVTAWSPMRS